LVLSAGVDRWACPEHLSSAIEDEGIGSIWLSGFGRGVWESASRLLRPRYRGFRPKAV